MIPGNRGLEYVKSALLLSRLGGWGWFAAGVNSRPGSGLICHILSMGMHVKKGMTTTMVKVVSMKPKNMIILSR